MIKRAEMRRQIELTKAEGGKVTVEMMKYHLPEDSLLRMSRTIDSRHGGSNYSSNYFFSSRTRLFLVIPKESMIFLNSSYWSNAISFFLKTSVFLMTTEDRAGS